MAQPEPTYSPSHPSSYASTEDCQVCKKFRDDSTVTNICFKLDDYLFEKVVGSNKRSTNGKKEPLENFLKAINALLNAGSGFVYVHAKDPSLLAEFDDKVDIKMNSLIADDSLFHHNFYRCHHDDKHVCFRVKQCRRVHISTLCFNSKVSFDSRLADPTPAQIRRLMKPDVKSEQSGSQASAESEISDQLKELSKGDQVYIKTSRGTFSFNENARTQAKEIPKDINNITDRMEFVKELKKYIWKKSSEYITAFSKVHSGGSIYFGLSEIEEKLKKQVSSKNDETLTCKSRKFKCSGVAIRQQEHEEIKQFIKSKVNDEMLFFAKDKFPNPVSVVFHSVTGEEALCVIEVKVEQFHGMVFNSKLGPQSYKWNKETKECDVMPPVEWIKLHKSDFSPRTPSS